MPLAALLAAAPTAAAFTPGSATEILSIDARISRAQARATALRACAGSAVVDRLERARTGLVYTFEIHPIVPTHGRVIVRVDARDGGITSVHRPGDRR